MSDLEGMKDWLAKITDGKVELEQMGKKQGIQLVIPRAINDNMRKSFPTGNPNYARNWFIIEIESNRERYPKEWFDRIQEWKKQVLTPRKYCGKRNT